MFKAESLRAMTVKYFCGYHRSFVVNRFCACANSVHQASPQGEGPGDEATMAVWSQVRQISVMMVDEV